MSEPLDRYLTDSYRRDVMGEKVTVETPVPSEQLIAELEALIAKVDALHLGVHLANRDFVSYTNRRAMLRLLLQLRTEQARRKQEESKDATPGTGTLQGERADLDARGREVTPRPKS